MPMIEVFLAYIFVVSFLGYYVLLMIWLTLVVILFKVIQPVGFIYSILLMQPNPGSEI
jgi:hypothetical protein